MKSLKTNCNVTLTNKQILESKTLLNKLEFFVCVSVCVCLCVWVYMYACVCIFVLDLLNGQSGSQ